MKKSWLFLDHFFSPKLHFFKNRNERQGTHIIFSIPTAQQKNGCITIGVSNCGFFLNPESKLFTAAEN